MPSALRATCLAASLLTLGTPAWAYGQIDWLQASATQVAVGSTVSFGVGWNIQGSFLSGGGSNLVEPAPADGYNEWLLNWYWTETITPLAIDVWVSGPAALSFSEPLGVAPGSAASGSFGFQMSFDAPGVYEVSATGSFSVRQTRTDQAELGTRYCYNGGDPDNGVYLVCDSWSYSYPFQQSDSDFGGSMNMASVQIQVQAVPEPAALLLGCAGLAGLAGLRRWRR